ncbi:MULTISPECIES: hypothetical protein [unclassified Bradyrhizobium]|uniref:hypothetical protein n=1 Tax=unclassified Bradyrhizobium TaxID=2631580 RepID=UPI0028EFE324|nr:MULTISPECIES: hypothetical protein [unclassified Bradyrhizobium]
MRPFVRKLEELKNVSIEVVADDTPDEEGTAAIGIKFSDGTTLQAFYWRLVQDGRAELASFDHQKKYGLPAPIDAKKHVSTRLTGKICRNVQFDDATGDLTLVLGETSKLQVFNFTGYESWTLRFPDGTGEYSNYAQSQ